jgi:hypothetical protein
MSETIYIPFEDGEGAEVIDETNEPYNPLDGFLVGESIVRAGFWYLFWCKLQLQPAMRYEQMAEVLGGLHWVEVNCIFNTLQKAFEDGVEIIVGDPYRYHLDHFRRKSGTFVFSMFPKVPGYQDGSLLTQERGLVGCWKNWRLISPNAEDPG